ncbi:MAG: CFI-box-CTERM domain-containing protein [Candidatus Bathyarchaeota archaeon]
MKGLTKTTFLLVLFISSFIVFPASIVSGQEEGVSFNTTVTIFSVSVDKKEYSPGELVTVRGTAAPDADVSVEVKNPSGVIIFSPVVRADSEGIFTLSFNLPGAAAEGIYIIATSLGDSAARTSFTVAGEPVSPPVGGCVIATSTYGSELAPEVQFLRTFREETVYSTSAGASFMAVFNGFYYSWSPPVAAQIWDNGFLQSAGRILISPLLGILHVSTMVNSVFSFNSELAIVLTGLTASALIGAVYFMPITTGALYAVKRKRKTLPKANRLAVLLVPLSISLALIYLGEIVSSALLMMAATGSLVVFTIAIVSGVISLKILRHR